MKLNLKKGRKKIEVEVVIFEHEKVNYIHAVGMDFMLYGMQDPPYWVPVSKKVGMADWINQKDIIWIIYHVVVVLIVVDWINHDLVIIVQQVVYFSVIIDEERDSILAVVHYKVDHNIVEITKN